MATAQDLVRALAHGGRLEMLAHLDPRIWEVVGGGPLGHTHVSTTSLTSTAQRVAAELNPQPLPPVAAGQQMLWGLARSIIVQGGRELGEAQQIFMTEIDDWCGTGWPRRWPFPWPDPDPRDDLRTALLLGGAIGATGLAAHYPQGELRDLFEKSAGMLLDAALA
jgi:hypothetical protein